MYLLKLLLLTLLFPIASRAAGFSLFFQTPAINRHIGSFIAVDAGDYKNLLDLAKGVSILENPNGKSLMPGKNEPLDVTVVVPKGAPQLYIDSFVREARHEILKQFSNANVSVQISYLDTERELTEYETEARYLQTEKPQDAEEEAFLSSRLKEVTESATHLRSWKNSWYAPPLDWLNKRNPVNRAVAARVVATAKFGIAASVIVSKYGLDITSAALGIYNGLVTFAFGYFATEFSQWCTTHSFFLSKRFPWLEKMRPLGFLGLNFRPVEFYNQTPEVKSLSVNIFRSLGLAYIARSLAYMTHRVIQSTGAPVSSPNNLEFFVEGIGLTLIETAGDSAMDVGLRSLTQKGYLTYSSRSYLLWTISVADTVMHSFFRSGDTASAYITMAINTVGKASIYVASKFAKRQNKKLIVVSNHIARESSDFAHVIRQNNLGEAVNLKPRSDQLQRLRDPKTGLRSISEILNLKDVKTDDLIQIRNAIVDGEEPTISCATWLRTQI